MEVFRKRNLLKTRVKSCLQLPGIRRCPSGFVIISVYFLEGCKLILLWYSQHNGGGCREGRREDALLRTVTSLAWKCLFLSLSSLCPPTEVFVTKSPYFGPHKNVCISINLWIDGQTGGTHISNCGTDGYSRSTEIEKVVGIRNPGRQKEWHTVARMSLGTEAWELRQKTELRASVFRKNGRCGNLMEKKLYNLVWL